MERGDSIRRLADQLRVGARSALDEGAHISILKKLVSALSAIDKLNAHADPEDVRAARERAENALADWSTWKARKPRGS